MMKKTSGFWGIVFIIITLLLVLSMCNGGGSHYGAGRCTICGKPATHTFQGSGYCDQHYTNAVNWAFDHVK